MIGGNPGLDATFAGKFGRSKELRRAFAHPARHREVGVGKHEVVRVFVQQGVASLVLDQFPVGGRQGSGPGPWFYLYKPFPQTGPQWSSKPFIVTYPLARTMVLPLYLPLALTLAPAAFLWRGEIRRRRRPVGHCQGCGYNRAGLAVGVKCPECGRG